MSSNESSELLLLAEGNLLALPEKVNPAQRAGNLLAAIGYEAVSADEVRPLVADAIQTVADMIMQQTVDVEKDAGKLEALSQYVQGQTPPDLKRLELQSLLFWFVDRWFTIQEQAQEAERLGNQAVKKSEEKPQEGLTDDAAVLANAETSDMPESYKLPPGQETAFANFFSTYHQQILSYTIRNFSGLDPERIAQETFLKALRFPHMYYPDHEGYRGTHPMPWLLKIAKNTAIDRFREKFGRRVQDTDLTVEVEDKSGNFREPSEPADDSVELGGILLVVREVLSLNHRRVLELHALGFTSAEMAEVLGVPEGTVKSRIHHARRRARKALKESGLFDEHGNPIEDQSI